MLFVVILASQGCGRFGFESEFQESNTDSSNTDVNSTDSTSSDKGADGSDWDSDTADSVATLDTNLDDTDNVGDTDIPAGSDSDSDSVVVDTVSDAGTAMDSDSGVDTGADSGIDTTSDTGIDTSADTGADTGLDTQSDGGTDSTDTDTGSDTNSYSSIMIVGDGTDATHPTLADAINDANLDTNHDLITFQPAWTESLTADLPWIEGNVTILGDGTLVDGSGISIDACLKIRGGNVIVTALSVVNCKTSAVQVSYTGDVVIYNNYFENNYYAYTCFNNTASTNLLFGPDNVVVNTVYDGLFSTCDGLEIVENQFFNTTNRAIVVEGSDGRIVRNLAVGTSNVHPNVDIINTSTNWTVWHNTLVGVSSNALNVSGTSTGHNISNNIFAFATYWGLSTGGASVTAENNLFYNNGSSPPCDNACSSQSNPIMHTDALDDTVFADVATDDYHLISASPAVNAGVDLGLNGYVNAADVGCFESVY